MTLYRQLSIALLLLVLLALGGTLYLGIANLRGIYEEQLASHARDTAASLEHSIAPFLENDDVATIQSAVSAAFEQGDYLAIEVTGPDGAELAARARKPELPDVPGWFARLIPISATESGVPVMSGQNRTGVIHVTPDPSRAYIRFWRATVNTLQVYAIASIVLLALAMLSLRLLLRPLQAIREQADAITNNRHPMQEKLPWTMELRSVVSAMNRLSAKVSEIFSEQAALTEAVREQVYLDPLTAVGNRRYFERILPALVEDHDQVSNGALLMLELHHLSELNVSSGYPAGDRVLQRTAELISIALDTMENCYLARISGACFAIIAVGFQEESADALAGSLCQALHQLRADGLVAYNNIVHIGIAMWRQGYNTRDLISEADLALRSAQSVGQNTWQRYNTIVANQTDIYGTSRWRSHIRDVIDTGSVQLAVQPVTDIRSGSRGALHHEVLARIPDPGGTGMQAALFMPMAERLGLASQLDKLTIRTLLDQIRADSHSQRRYAVNLSSTSLHDSVFIQWLCGTLARVPGIVRRIVVEFPEYGVIANLQNVRNLVARLSELGVECGIDHFGRGFSAYGYLHSLGVRYVKIDAVHLRDIESDRDNRFFIQSLTDTLHSIDIRVYILGVETNTQKEALERMHVDGIQGYLLGRPELMEPVVSGNILQE